jgi:hypothetical protein
VKEKPSTHTDTPLLSSSNDFTGRAGTFVYNCHIAQPLISNSLVINCWLSVDFKVFNHFLHANYKKMLPHYIKIGTTSFCLTLFCLMSFCPTSFCPTLFCLMSFCLTTFLPHDVFCLKFYSIKFHSNYLPWPSQGDWSGIWLLPNACGGQSGPGY